MQILNRAESDIAKYAEAVLPNGLRVIVASRPMTRTVAWQMSFEAGMIDDKAHLAHLVEHLVLDYKDLKTRIHSAGAHYNGGTKLDEMQFEFAGHVESLPVGFELMQNIFRPLEVTDERTKKEAEVLKREMRESGGIRLLLNTAHYRVLGGDEVGVRYTVKFRKKLKLTGEDVSRFHREHFKIGKTTLSFVSPLSIDDALEMIGTAMGDFTDEESTGGQRKIEYSKKKKFHSYRNTYMPTLAAWHQFPNPSFMQAIELAFLTQIMSGTGKLYQKLRNENQLSYSVGCQLSSFNATSYQLIYLNLKGRRIGKATRLITEVLDDMCRVMEGNEFEQFRKGYARKLDSSEEQAGVLCELLMRLNRYKAKRQWSGSIANHLITPQTLKQELSAMTPESVATTAQTLFAPANRHVFLSGYYWIPGWMKARKFANGGQDKKGDDGKDA